MSKIFENIEHQFDLLSCMLSKLSDYDYKRKGDHISSIGGHVRHVIEYVQILINSDLSKPIDYSVRKRDLNISDNREYALGVLDELKASLVKADQPVLIREEEEILTSSYMREMLYMHEHIVHHCAILRVELETHEDFEIDPCFGFANSTLKHMESNVSA